MRNRTVIRWCLGAMVAMVSGTAPLAAADKGPIAISEIKRDTPVDFEQEVLPILRQKCLACHNTTKAESELILETPQAILKGGALGAAAVAGQGSESLILQVASRQGEPMMPPDGNNVGAQPLTPDELGLLKLWIDQGAKGEVKGSTIQWQPLPPGVNPIYAVAVSPDGQYAAAGRANQIFVYHVPTKRELGRLTDPALMNSGIYSRPGVAHLDLIQALRFSPQGDLLASGGYRTVKLWRRPQNVHQADLAGLESIPRAAAASSDGRWLAVGEESGKIRIFDFTTQQLARTLEGHAGPITGLHFTPDSSRLYSTSRDKTVRGWNAADGAPVGQLEAPSELLSLALLNKGAQLATGGQDNLIRIWSTTSPSLNIPALPAAVSCFQTSADRKWLAAGTADGKLTIVDLATGQAVRSWDAHPGGVTAVAFSGSGQRLVTAGSDQKLQVWDPGTGQSVALLAAGTVSWTAVALNPAGTQLAAGAADGALRSWKLDAAEPRPFPGDNGVAASVSALSPDRRLLATGALVEGKPAVTLRDTASGAVVRQLLGHVGPITALNFSGDGSRLISGSEDKTARIWQVADGAEVAKLPAQNGAILQAALHPNGQQAVTVAADNVCAAWNLADGAQLYSLAGHTGTITAVLYLPNGQSILTASLDKSVRWWNAGSGQMERSVTLEAEARAMALNKDGSRLAVADGNKVKVVQLGDGQIQLTLTALTQPVQQVSFAADDSRLLATDGKAYLVWDAAKGVLVEEVALETSRALFGGDAATVLVALPDKTLGARTLRAERLWGDHTKAVTGLVYLPDGQALLTSSEDGTLRRFSAADGQQQFAANHAAPVLSLALSPHAQLVATGGGDNQVKVWNAGNGSPAPKHALPGSSGPVKAVAFTADNVRLAAADSASNQVLVWDLNEGVAEEIVRPAGAPVTQLAGILGTDNLPLFLSASQGNAVQVWSPHSVRRIPGHSQPVTALAAVNDTQFLSGSTDGTVRHWESSNGQAVRQMAHGGPVAAVAVRPDGQRFASVGGNVARLWNATNGQQVAELKGDYRKQFQVNDLTRMVALAKRKIDNANADLKAATERKAAEEKNATAVAEAKTKAEEEFNKKSEAAKQPIADKEAADQALAAAQVAQTQAEAAQKTADEGLKNATEALAAAQTARDAAAKAATDAEAAAKAASEKLAQSQEAAKNDAANPQLAEAAAAAVKEAEQAEAARKTAAEAKTAADTKFTETETAKKTADEAKKKADAELATAKTQFTQAEAKVKQVAPAAQKAVDERTAAERALQGAVRSVERAGMAVQKATEEIPMYEKAVAETTEQSKQVEAQLEAAKKEVPASELPQQSVAFSPDSRTVATAGDDQLAHLWDAESGAPIENFSGQGAALTALTFLPQGNLVSAAANHTAVVWNTNPEWKLERVIGDVNDPQQLVDRVTALDFSPDGKVLATGSGEPSRSGQLKLWNVETGSLIRELPDAHSDTIFGLEFSPDGQQLASSAADRFAKVFEVNEGKFIRSFEGHTHHVLGVSWRADGRVLATAGADNVIKVWNVRTGDQERTIQGFGKEVTAIRFLAEGDTVVASAGDNAVRIKNAANGGNVRDLPGATDFVYGVAASADGKLIAAGGQDSVVRLWNDAGQAVVTFEPPKPQ